jgi:RimJ/RimL family protein N-acetyltransferase
MAKLSIEQILGIRMANSGKLVVLTPEWSNVGAIALFSDVIHGRYGDIHFYIAPKYRKKLVVCSFVREILDYAFEVLCLRRLKAQIAVDNVESWKLAEHCGFKKVGVLPGEGLYSGVEIDTLLYCLEPKDRLF